MMEPYKNVAVIYGGSGRELACAIHREVERLHFDEHYPIKAHILADEILSSANILETVRDLISSSTVCVTILTFDDVNETRVRQNVLIEIGMAMMVMDRDHCYFLSNRFPVPSDFPSDLNDFANPNLFDPSQVDEEATKLCQTLLHQLCLEKSNRILGDADYLFDFHRVFDDIPASIRDERFDVQLESILDCWCERLESFDFVSERIMYLLERLGFLTVFSLDDKYFDFLDKLSGLFNPTTRDFEIYGRSYLSPLCTFVKELIRYTKVKGESVVPKSKRKDSLDQRELLQELKSILRRLDSVYGKLDSPEYNWLIRERLYSFRAVVAMKNLFTGIGLGEKPQVDMALDSLEKLKKALSIVQESDTASLEMWEGYLYYDLARAYADYYRASGDRTYLPEMRDCIVEAVNSRKKWVEGYGFPEAFANALSREYFLASTWQFEQQYANAPDQEAERREILDSLVQLKGELESYCKSTEFGRLFAMRDTIDSLIDRVAGERSESK